MPKQKHIKCSGCGKNLGLFHKGLLLTDYRAQPHPKDIGEWCDEHCFNEWLDTEEGKNLIAPGM